MKPYIEERLKQVAIDPGSDWEDSDLKRLAVRGRSMDGGYAQEILQE